MEIFILYCIIILILHKFFIWKTNCITNFFKNYITWSCKCNCIRSVLYNYIFLFLDFILCFPRFNFHCISCFTWRSQYDDTIYRTLQTAIGTIVGCCLMVDTFLLHFSDFCANVKILKTSKGFFWKKYNLQVLKL